MLRVGVVRGRHFDNVRRDEVDALEAADDGAQLARCPAAGFGRAGCGGDWRSLMLVRETEGRSWRGGRMWTGKEEGDVHAGSKVSMSMDR